MRKEKSQKLNKEDTKRSLDFSRDDGGGMSVLVDNEGGQVLLLILLVMGVALSIGLAVSSRSSVSLKQSSSSLDASSCLSSAEAGIEDALQALSSGPNSPYVNFCDNSGLTSGGWDEPDTLDPNIVVCDLDASSCGDMGRFSEPESDVAYCIWENKDVFRAESVPQDTSLQIPLRGVAQIASVDLHWSGMQAVPVFSQIGVRDSNGETKKLDVGAFDPDSGAGNCDIGGNNDPANSAPSTLIPGGTMINIAVAPVDPAYPSDKIFLRLRFLCGEVENVIAVGRDCNGLGCAGNDVNLPAYSHVVRSSCINKTVTRELEAVKTFPLMPALFDFGVYSGSTTEPLAP